MAKKMRTPEERSQDPAAQEMLIHAEELGISTAFSRAEIPGGDDELHLAAGFGIAFDKFQLDVGLDISELRDTAAVSMIYSF